MDVRELENSWGKVCSDIHQDLIDNIEKGLGTTSILENLQEDLPTLPQLREIADGALLVARDDVDRFLKEYLFNGRLCRVSALQSSDRKQKIRAPPTNMRMNILCGCDVEAGPQGKQPPS